VKLTAKLQAKWAKALADDGFEDLEGADRDAPLSNRGKLHYAGTASDGEPWTAQPAAHGAVPGSSDVGPDLMMLAQRVEQGSGYSTWSLDVWRSLPGRTRVQRERKAIWKRWAHGDSMKQIARDTGLSFHAVRVTVKAIEEESKCQDPAPDPKKILTEINSTSLAQLLAAFLVSLKRRQT
jgi:hypothetical protein